MRSVKDCLRHFASSNEPIKRGEMCSFVIYVSSPVVNADCDFKCQLLIVRWRWILQTLAGNGMWALSKVGFTQCNKTTSVFDLTPRYLTTL